MPRTVKRTTLTLPTDLVERIDRAVRAGRARSRTEFIAEVVARDLATQERDAVDAEFAHMADDPDYLAESAQLEAQLAGAGAEALRLAEHRT